MTQKELYCISRAEELNRTCGMSFKMGYEQGEREWNQTNRVSRQSHDEYDDDIDYDA